MQDIVGDRTASLQLHCFVLHCGSTASERVVCAVLTYFSVYRSRMSDLFIAFSVFIGPATLFSVISMAIKIKLLLRRVAERRNAGKLRRSASQRNFLQLGMKVALRMLAEEYVLRHDQLEHEELKSSNDMLVHQGYSCAIGVVCEVLQLTIPLRSGSRCLCLLAWPGEANFLAAGPALLHFEHWYATRQLVRPPFSVRRFQLFRSVPSASCQQPQLEHRRGQGALLRRLHHHPVHDVSSQSDDERCGTDIPHPPGPCSVACSVAVACSPLQRPHLVRECPCLWDTLVFAAIMLTHKLVSLKHFPEIWEQHVQLRSQAKQLADRSKQLQLERAGIQVVRSGTPSGAQTGAPNTPTSARNSSPPSARNSGAPSARNSGRNSPRAELREPMDPHFARFAEAMAAPARMSTSSRYSPKRVTAETLKIPDAAAPAPARSNGMELSLAMDPEGLDRIVIQLAIVPTASTHQPGA